MRALPASDLYQVPTGTEHRGLVKEQGGLYFFLQSDEHRERLGIVYEFCVDTRANVKILYGWHYDKLRLVTR